MEKKMASDPGVALDYRLKPRIILSLFTFGAGLVLCALGFLTNNVLKKDQEQASNLGIKLDLDALYNLTRMCLAMGVNLVANTLFLTAYLARRWYRPNREKKDSLFQKTRPFVKMLMEGQFFIATAILALLTTFNSAATTKWEPGPRGFENFRQRIRFPDHYISNHYFGGLVAVSWLTTFGYMAGFALEVVTLIAYKRRQKLVFIET